MYTRCRSATFPAHSRFGASAVLTAIRFGRRTRSPKNFLDFCTVTGIIFHRTDYFWSFARIRHPGVGYIVKIEWKKRNSIRVTLIFFFYFPVCNANEIFFDTYFYTRLHVVGFIVPDFRLTIRFWTVFYYYYYSPLAAYYTKINSRGVLCFVFFLACKTIQLYTRGGGEDCQSLFYFIFFYH